MTQCIYRKVTLNSNKPDDDDTASAEHIIPWALGGSNGLVTPDASKAANNDLGSDVDARFADTLPLAIKRHQLQLKSQNGNIAPIVWRGESPEGFVGNVIISPDGTMDVALEPSVERPEKGQSGPMTVSGPRERIEPILDGMLKGMRKRKEQAYTESGKLLKSLDDFWNESEQTLIDQLRVRVEYFNYEAWTRGILKIALAAGHKLLGPDWTFGPTAEVLRDIVMNPQQSWPKTSPRGYIAGKWDRSLRLALGKTAAVRDSNQHTVAVLPATEQGEGVEGIIAISLFGGNGVPEAVIRAGKLPQVMVDALNRMDNQDTIMGYRVDPLTRVTVPILFGQIDRRVAAQGPTNKRSMRLYQDRSLR
jgi:hypothetical protein